MRFIIFSGLVSVLASCTHAPRVKSTSEPTLLRFQNMLGLEMTRAGCSILDYGGLDRLCEYSQTRPADLIFHIGPSLSRVVNTDSIDKAGLARLRLLLMNEWRRQKVAFYALSALDLEPSLEGFLTATRDSGVKLISTNILSGDRHLFEPFFFYEEAGLIFLSFSEPLSLLSDDSGFAVQNPVLSFKEILKRLPHTSQPLHLLGSLSKNTRQKLSAATDRSVIFIGGLLSESNTIEIENEARHLWIKAPDRGRGLGELVLTPTGQILPVTGNYRYDYRAILLPKTQITSPECVALGKTVSALDVKSEAGGACVPVSRWDTCPEKTDQ